MKKIIFLSILIVILAAYFASSNPDGLEKSLGLINKDTAASPVSPVILGASGVLLTFGVFFAVAKMARKP